MVYYYPDYFYDFKCVGGKSCPDSCCHIWQITVDKDTYKKYKSVTGELGRRMSDKIDRFTGKITPHGEEHRCEFLNEDNLCDIILELGEDYLCETCRTHPRHEEVYRNVRELSISITCPIACKSLLMREEPARICRKVSNETDRFDIYFDEPLFNQLLYVRDNMLKLIKRRDMGISGRMLFMLGMAHDVQMRMIERQKRRQKGFIYNIVPSYPEFTEQEKSEIKHIVDAYYNPSAYNKEYGYIIKSVVSRKLFINSDTVTIRKAMSDMIFALCTMEQLNPTWFSYLQSILNIRAQMTDAEYLKDLKKFNKEITDVQLEQLLFYFVYLYCLSSVYDGQLFAKIKMAIVNTLIIRELWFMKWLEENRHITIDEQVELAHRFAREVENSDENMEQWGSLMQRNPRFSLELLVDILT